MGKVISKSESSSITYLRGIAALGVVLYHVREDLWVGWNRLPSTKSATLFDKICAFLSIPTPFMGHGVILFFILSGFCICLPYVGDNKREFIFGEYWIRRFFRIYPPYFAAIILTLLIEIILVHSYGLGKLSKETYLMNFLMLQNYTSGPVPINGALWTLPIEMELYITFPIVFFLLNRWGTKVLIGFTIVVSSIALLLYLNNFNWLIGSFAIYWFIWSAGAILAKYYSEGRLKVPSKWLMLSATLSLGIGIIAQASKVDPSKLEYLFGYFYFCVLWLAITTEHKWNNLIPKMLVKVLTLLGTISFSLYLIHKPMFRLCGVIWVGFFEEKPINFLIPLSFVVLIIIFSWAFYVLIEAPSHIFAKKIAKNLSLQK